MQHGREWQCLVGRAKPFIVHVRYVSVYGAVHASRVEFKRRVVRWPICPSQIAVFCPRLPTDGCSVLDYWSCTIIIRSTKLLLRRSTITKVLPAVHKADARKIMVNGAYIYLHVLLYGSRRTTTDHDDSCLILP